MRDSGLDLSAKGHTSTSGSSARTRKESADFAKRLCSYDEEESPPLFTKEHLTILSRVRPALQVMLIETTCLLLSLLPRPLMMTIRSGLDQQV